MPVFGVYDVKAYSVLEGAFGVTPASPAFQWIGAVQNLDPTFSRNALQIYSFDQQRDPKFFPYMEKTIDYKVTYHPQDITLLTAAVQSVNNTYTFEENWLPQAGVSANQRYYRYLGSKCGHARIQWKVGQPINVQLSFMCRDISPAFPDQNTIAGATYAAESAVQPFFFSDTFITINPIGSVGGSSTINILDAEVTVNNRLDRTQGYTIGDTKLANLPLGKREVDFSITRLFEDQNQVDQFVSTTSQGTPFSIVFPLGPTNTLTITNAKWNPLNIPKDVKRDALVFSFRGKGFQPIGGGNQVLLQ